MKLYCRRSCECARTFDFSRSSLFVETLRIPLFHHLDRRVNEDFDKAESGLFVDLSGDGTVCGVR